MTRIPTALLYTTCLIIPFVFAVVCFSLAAAGPSFHVIGPVGIPCLFLGLMGSQLIVVTKSLDQRIADLERRLDEKK